MNKWIIFIIIAGAVSAGMLLVRAVSLLSPPETPVDFILKEEGADMNTNIQIVNNSPYTIAPGMLVIHTPSFSRDLNFLNKRAPEEYKPLAEIGEPTAAIVSLERTPGVYGVFRVEAIEPFGIQSVVLAPYEADAMVSYMAMIMQTNDGVVWINSEPLYQSPNQKQYSSVWAEILDMGTEKNSPILSGFSGGQPDPSRGEENIDNGTPTNEPVRHHPQFYEDDSVSEELVRIDINT